MLTLRPYQQHAVTAALSALRQGHHPVVSLPTGSGKSLCLAALSAEYVRRGQRVLIVTHRRELLVQDAAAFAQLAPDIPSGVYSAGLQRRDVSQSVIFGGVQSCYNRMGDLQQAGDFELIIIDEAHLVPRSADTMYGALLAAMPTARRVGLTATPYRMDSSLLYQGPGALFDLLAIHVEPKTLIPDYLAPLVGVGTDQIISTAGVHSAQGDFIAKELEQNALEERLIRETVTEARRFEADRHHWLVFCITVAHAQAVTEELTRQGINAALVTGETKKEVRDTLIHAYRHGTLTALVNCNVLTTGFDTPHTDCLVMLRPTESKGLWEQMLGRGMRKAPGKENCLILDFAGNIARHGAIGVFNKYRPSTREKQEQERKKEQEAATARAIAHAARAALGDPMGTGEPIREMFVKKARYLTAPSKKYPDKTNLIVEYHCIEDVADFPYPLKIRQFICLEYSGNAAWHAKMWFRRRGVEAPLRATDARELAKTLPIPTALTVQLNNGYWNVVLERWPEETTVEDLSA